MDFGDEDASWRQCEVAWLEWLRSERYVVLRTNEASGNSSRSNAPLIEYGTQRLRAPDFQTSRNGVNEYWEVKFRGRSEFDSLTGQLVHWMSLGAFKDYVTVANATGCRVWLVLYEASTSTATGRWLMSDVRDLVGAGRIEKRFDQTGTELDAWVWPVVSMEVIAGPAPKIKNDSAGLLPSETSNRPIDPARLEPFERKLRKRRAHTEELPKETEGVVDPVEAPAMLETDFVVGLDVLRRSLGIPSLPRYSVLRVGSEGLKLDDLLGLLDYGIRLFLITRTDHGGLLLSNELQAFKDSRLLEWAIVPDLDGKTAHWVVDGVMPEPSPLTLRQALKAAEDTGGINVGQYSIVHDAPDSDLLIKAGAGTGKTETMSERILFLLATSGENFVERGGAVRPLGLRADDIVLVTFTREASRQMRERIGRTLMLRQRLCRRSVLPALAWMMQLSGCEIETIHTYAKHLVQSTGSSLGLTPNLRVSSSTMEFRRFLGEALSPRLADLYSKHPRKAPASHLWQQHIRALWEALENNGVSLLLREDSSNEPLRVEWGGSNKGGLEGSVEQVTKDALIELTGKFHRYCIENQSIPASQLVPFALAAMKNSESRRVKRPRYLFVDEFQDTDSMQIDLLLEISAVLGARLFVVGDAKQGIYRFRGAEGNAFAELQARVQTRPTPVLRTHTLSRNFRSGAKLLDSIHPYFATWGESDLLHYSHFEKLRANLQSNDLSQPIDLVQVRKRDYSQRAASEIGRWRLEDPEATVAVLCRRNSHALAVRSAIQALGGSCELLVGGSFFTSPAVRELHVLLQSVANASDDAALLQLCETRWASGMLRGERPRGVSSEDWGEQITPPVSWSHRFASMASKGTYRREDLEALRRRLLALDGLLSRMPTIAWIVESIRVFAPEISQLPGMDDESERRRYSRCLDHLVTLLDSNFKSSPVTLQGVLSWLQLQIATNRSEDEPVEWTDLQGRTTALTVHKAKGLEFDRVLVPMTWSRFAPPRSVKTRVAVLRRSDSPPRVLWQWRGGHPYDPQFSNVAEGDSHLWIEDEEEIAREETRLLYVAMTRARQHLKVFLPEGASGRRSQQPDSWADLLTRKA